MSERKRKQRSAGDKIDEDLLKPTLAEINVANYLHRKLPSKEGRLSGMIVRVFVAMEAIELLMNSPWAKSDGDSELNLFTSQTAAVNFMTTLFQKQMFQRAIRVKKKPTKHREDAKSSKHKLKKLTDGKVSGKSIIDAVADESLSPQEPDPACPRPSIFSSISSSINEFTTKSSNKKPMRLEIVDEQTFVLDDPQTFYVWIYEPPPGLFNWLAGAALIVGIILCCLFPIWPSELRQCAYYLTIVASGLLGLLLLIGLIRFCFYLLVWLSTLGQYSFWIFPNYFEDCGFFESFRPLYSCKHVSDVQVTLNKKGKSKAKPSNVTIINSSSTTDSNSTVSSDANDIQSLCTENIKKSSEEAKFKKL
ncbi:Translocation protein [Schistosoma japonicum]|uniref:Translocation protein SEC62 n=3 Tax=Schistosoma japonicum TaxID=6182 RepID=C1L6I1_SCHJA|nr:Translocation protein [Schistosoma japonicum]TNN17266.1 Translocation protein [Schistosoma japonicum]TNN17267.1 Translocation protein [Schistosoma japonicum]CAX70309.1 Translocation protein SEC62 [Schistosoma japonicum]